MYKREDLMLGLWIGVRFDDSPYCHACIVVQNDPNDLNIQVYDATARMLDRIELDQVTELGLVVDVSSAGLGKQSFV